MDSRCVPARCFVIAAMMVLLVLAAVAVSAQRPMVGFTDITERAGVSGIPQHGGHGAQVVDVNGDGHLDLHVTNIFTEGQPFPDELYLGRGDGTFQDVSATCGLAGNGSGTHGTVFADLDGDGDLDCFKARTLEPQNALWLNDGEASFTEAADIGLARATATAQIGTRGVVAADFDKDGDVDLFALCNDGNANELYINDGKGRFSEEAAKRGIADPREMGTGYAGLGQGCTAADYDNDGDVDIYTCIRGMDNRLWQNDGRGYFTDVAKQAGVNCRGGGDGAAFADIDNDGDLDLLADAGGQNLVMLIYRNNGDGTFRDETLEQGVQGGSYGPALGDVDNDGDVDLYVPRDYQGHSLYLNDGRGVFAQLRGAEAVLMQAEGPTVLPPSVAQNRQRDARCAVFADVDEDGDLDIMVVCKRGFNVLLRNDYNAGRWLQVSVQGPGGLNECLGAKVSVFERGGLGNLRRLVGFQEVRSATGYCGQAPPVLHFGLGSRQRVELQVVYPDGHTVQQRGVAGDQVVVVRRR